MHIVLTEDKPAAYSWTTGFVRKHELSLLEEWKANPVAVLERFDREGRLDELEVLLDRGILH
jgi:hypothetical protein